MFLESFKVVIISSRALPIKSKPASLKWKRLGSVFHGRAVKNTITSTNGKVCWVSIHRTASLTKPALRKRR